MSTPSNITLYPLTEADRDLILLWRNAPEVRRNMYSGHEIRPEEHRAWFERMKQDPSRRWYLCRDARGNPVGVVYFTSIDQDDGSALWGFYTKPQSSTGVGSRILFSALKHAFDELGLRKLTGEVLATNSASLRLHRKFGFAQEGVFHDRHFDGETHVDVIRLVLRSHEWVSGKGRLRERVVRNR